MNYTQGMRVEHTTKFGLGVVTKVEHDRVRIQFDNEVEEKCLMLTAPNIIPSDAPTPKKQKTTVPTKRKYEIPDDLIDHVKNVGCFIYVETKLASVPDIATEYEKATKEALPNDDKVVLIQENRPIMPVEWRVSFTPPPEGFYTSYPHDVNKKRNYWRVNKKAFIFELFALGFRLGHNPGIMQVRAATV